MNIRNFEPGFEARQQMIYNAAAGSLPGFKPATVEDITKRTTARGFDPATRLFAELNGEIVGYCTWDHNGRIGFPWCLPGHEQAAEPLLHAALQAMRDKQMATAFTAYRADWTSQLAFLEANGFQKVRDMVNFEQSMFNLPTTINRRGFSITPLRQEDVPALAAMGKGIIRIPEARLAKYILDNPYFPPSSVFALRRSDDTPRAIGIFIEDARYADAKKVDSQAPCFRLGAFGSEEQNTKRVNGLFSFLVGEKKDITIAGLDLLWHASGVADPDGVSVLAAQVPSDAPQLLDFYRSYFNKQGSFPIHERSLA